MTLITKNFISIDKNHFIKIIINNQIAYFKIHYYNEENIKTLLDLFRETIIFLKNNEIKIVRQEISINEINLFKNSSIYKKINDEYVYIDTEIYNFVDEFYSILGLK